MLRSLLLLFLLSLLFYPRVAQILLSQIRGKRPDPLIPMALRRSLFWGGVIVSLGLALIVYFQTRNPIFGLAAFLLIPVWPPLFSSFLMRRRLRELEVSSLPLMWSLLGFLRLGQSFPTALGNAARGTDNRFARELSGHLRRFQRGTSLRDCLSSFRRTAILSRVLGVIGILESAYLRGLPLAGLLERMLGPLESEIRLAEGIRGARKSALGQAGVAIAIPWFLVLFSQWAAGAGAPGPWAIALILVFQALGTGALLWVSSFY